MPKFVTPRAVVFGAVGDDPTFVDASNPLPIVDTNSAESLTALENIEALMGTPATSLPPFELGKVGRYSRKIIDISSSAEVAQIAAVAGQTIRVHYFRLITPVAANELAVWNGPVSDAAQLDLLNFSGAGAGFREFNEADPLWITGSNKGLVFKPTGSARITGLLLYTQSA
ncbi:hypothetical protein [Sphingobium fluviale]|uniref:Uncharacterized protein n=1 Tax=Sphingobium fluviale TaxID=2506423 RepID=A0A4Q1KHX6_9SPHN|nr:hypothetical protein [Sphingobium fluviale]RXR28965.1 hypothetical protein EQG66_07760 [Sphingobium fluviale]